MVQTRPVISEHIFFSVTETSQILGVSRETVYKLMRTGRLNQRKNAFNETILQGSDILKYYDLKRTPV